MEMGMHLSLQLLASQLHWTSPKHVLILFSNLIPKSLYIGLGSSSVIQAVLCSVPTKFPNFPSHLHHIETLNIANDPCMKY